MTTAPATRPALAPAPGLDAAIARALVRLESLADAALKPRRSRRKDGHR